LQRYWWNKQRRYSAELPNDGEPMRHMLALLFVIGSLSPIAYAQTTGQSPPRSNCRVTGGVNNGVILQNCSALPSPKYRLLQSYPIQKNEDGQFTRSVRIVVDAPYVPSNMAVFAQGKTVRGIKLENSTMIKFDKGTYGESLVYLVHQPSGEYTIYVTTSDVVTPANVDITFNVDLSQAVYLNR
jgi:hypothetical protein